MSDGSVLAELFRWLAYLFAASVPFLFRWVWALGTRVAVAESEIRYLKAEIAEDRKLLASLPADVKVIMAELKEIKRRLNEEHRASG